MRIKGCEHGMVEEAYRVLRTRIMKRELRPAEHLQVQQIADELSIGITPTREALIRLAAEDLIDVLSQKGFFAKVHHTEDLLTALSITKAVLCLSPRGRLTIAPDYAPRVETPSECATAMEDLHRDLAWQIGGTMTQKIIEMCSAKTHAYRVRSLDDAVNHQRVASHIVQLGELMRIGSHGEVEDAITCELNHQILDSGTRSLSMRKHDERTMRKHDERTADFKLIGATMTNSTYDILGVGFGPSGLALAAAIDEWNTDSAPRQVTALFLEKAQKTEWHGGLLLPGVHINNHLYKDLVTPRNPSSSLSFASYLHDVGRFYEFCIWNGSPSRIEWSDYVGWAARKLKHLVSYDSPCVGVSVESGGMFRVTTSGVTYSAQNVVLSSGWAAHVPDEWSHVDTQTAFHSSRFDQAETKIEALAAKGRPSVLVVGSGLSAAEVVLRLYQKFGGQIELTSVHRSVPFKHYNASEYAKPVFTPRWGNMFFDSDTTERERLIEAYRSTNYNGVPPALATTLWKAMYEARLMGQRTLDLIENTRIDSVDINNGTAHVELAHLGTSEKSSATADVVILCTGFRNSIRDDLLAPIADQLKRDEDGEILVGSDYSVALKCRTRGKLFLNGHCERTHGLGDSQNFGLVAYKAGVISDAIAVQMQNPGSEAETLPRRNFPASYVATSLQARRAGELTDGAD